MTTISSPLRAKAPAPPPSSTTNRRRARRTPMGWLRDGGLSTLIIALPMILVFGVFSWFPIGRALVMSFQETNLVTAAQFVGLDNFVFVLQDPLLGKAVTNTLWFAVLALVFGYPLPLAAAVLMSEVRRLRGLGPYPWLQDASSAMPSLVLEATWAAAGGTVIIYLAALVGVRTELYEAAEVDGAGVWRKIWHVTLPQLRGVLFITLILQVIGTSQVFLEPFLFTGGGPNNATLTILMLIYDYAFGSSLGGNYGAATALSLMLAGVLAVLSAVYFRVTRPWSS